MFNFSWTSPHEGEVKTLRFHKDPRQYGLGTYTDIDGNSWDVRGIMGEYIQARPYNSSDWRYSTAGTASLGSQWFDIFTNWLAYNVEVVDKEVVK